MDLFSESGVKLINAMKSKKISALEVMKAHLDRIEKINPVLNALVQQFPRDLCLKWAKEKDEQGAFGRLHGLPVTVKDKHLVKGLVTSVGSIALKGNVAKEDSTIVSRLKDEGAIVIGITNVPELMSSYETDNDVYGRTNNPYDLKRTPGGSSGGCAALVSSGCIPLSIGTDAGGSIRWPAHCTGIAGHKPTIGSVPNTGSPFGNAQGLIKDFATSGPLARHVEDLILCMPILMGPDGTDPHTVPFRWEDPSSVDVKSLRVAYLIDDGISEISKEVVSAVEEAARVLNAVKIEIPCIKNAYRLLWEGFYLGSDRGEASKRVLKMLNVEKPSALYEEFLEQAKKSELSVTDYKNLFREFDLFRLEFLEKTKEYDILITPVAATTAKLHGTTHKENRDMAHCMVHSITGWPVTVVKVGSDSHGLPIGIQIAAKKWKDHVALACASKVEALLARHVVVDPRFSFS